MSIFEFPGTSYILVLWRLFVCIKLCFWWRFLRWVGGFPLMFIFGLSMGLSPGSVFLVSGEVRKGHFLITK